MQSLFDNYDQFVSWLNGDLIALTSGHQGNVFWIKKTDLLTIKAELKFKGKSIIAQKMKFPNLDVYWEQVEKLIEELA
jgi:environmental stress-induced protein Ves